MKSNLFFAILITLLASCKKETNLSNLNQTYIELGSAIVVNEGKYNSNNAEISFIDKFGNVTNNIFSANNGFLLGDVLQSYYRYGNLGVLCVNNSQKIVVVDARTFKQKAIITNGVSYPRYSIGYGNKIYVSDGSTSGKLLVIDTTSLTVTQQIIVGKGPEEMAIVGNRLFVCNSGGFHEDSTISVINLTSNTVDATIKVGSNPTQIEKDPFGNLWILCKGVIVYGGAPDYLANRVTPASVIKLNTLNYLVTAQKQILNETDDFSNLSNFTINNDGSFIYYSIDNNKHYRLNANSLATAYLFQKPLYTLTLQKSTGNLWGGEYNFTRNGYIFKYSSTHQLIDSFKVGIAPNNIYFNE